MNPTEYLRKEIDFFNMAIYVTSLVILAFMIFLWVSRGASPELAMSFVLAPLWVGHSPWRGMIF